MYGPGTGYWKTGEIGMARLTKAGRVVVSGNRLRYTRFFDDFTVFPFTNVWMDIGGIQSRADPKVYVVQTATTAVQRCILMTTDPGDLVIDPTCGSGTTAYVAEQWGRRWITIDTSRVALTLARTRLMAGRFPFYLLADTPEGRKKTMECGAGTTLACSPTLSNTAESASDEPPRVLKSDGKPSHSDGDIRKGFVYKRVPHVTLKAIANNEEIDAIHAQWQEKLEPVRDKLNKLLKTKWEEWEIPREPEKDWPADARKLLKEYWELRQRRQQEIDASIARRADTEMLFDQPYEDAKRVRVTGPFTVESLSPHRTISVEEKKRRAEVGHAASGLKIQVHGPDQFGQMILDNLRAAGVQNTFKKERLKFDCLQPYAGQWIHGEGWYTEQPSEGKKSPRPAPLPEGEGTRRRVAVCIGPEHGTVGPQLVKEAAKEAVQGVGFDLLIVCGFAFDPHVSEEAKRYGKLVVLPTRMNPDLTMGELLKKTGSGNLFMVFGEPDVEVKRQTDGQIIVKLNGLDIYDPTTGEIRSSSTDDITTARVFSSATPTLRGRMSPTTN
jgi:adenine-specific DNA-methyltransferase